MGSKVLVNEEMNGIGLEKREKRPGLGGGYEVLKSQSECCEMEPRSLNREESLPPSPRPQAKSSRSVDRASTWDAPQATCTIS